MSTIDEVISRSRQSGEFTERRTFSVARGRAIQKLREFALVDPHYYILELIQSAVANGATFIDIQCDRTTTALSYVGGGFREQELAQLFDFLFASKDDVEHGALRQMALGVNALMLFEPDEIVIETGDGSLKGTTRVVISGKDDTVELGRPEQGLNGTYLRATGLRRRQVTRRSSLKSINGEPREFTAVENRCITAPVPILFNHNPLFGYSSQRTPESLWGFDRTITFDEGDLYGTVGIARRHSGAVFRLVTDGVWIQSARHKFPPGAEEYRFGGVITFDRLRKTADHGSIVEDERYRQMWARVRAYINQLGSGKDGGAGYNVKTITGEDLSTRDLLDVLREFDTVLLLDPEVLSNQEQNERARRISESIDAPAICIPRRTTRAVRELAGPEVNFVVPNLDDTQEVEFFTREEVGPPPRPWLIAPVDLDQLTLLDLAKYLPWPPSGNRRWLEENESEAAPVYKATWLLRGKVVADAVARDGELFQFKEQHLDPRGASIRARIFSPEVGDGQERENNIEVRFSNRVVWSGRNEAVAPGQLMIIDVDDVAPRTLWEPFCKEVKKEEKSRALMDTPVSGSPAALSATPLVERHSQNQVVVEAEFDLSARPKEKEENSSNEEDETEKKGSESQTKTATEYRYSEIGHPSDLVAELIAEIIVSRQANRLESAANLGLRAALRTEVEPDSNAAQLILTSLAHRVVKRIRSENGRRQVVFSVVDQDLDVEVLDIPVLRTLTGEGVSLRGLEEMMEKCHGLVYGVREDVTPDLRGLDQSLILALDPNQEQLLISLIGPTAYVRVDRRDVLGSYNGVFPNGDSVLCRDVAPGLREYPDFPLLIEGFDGSVNEWSSDQKKDCLRSLLEQLIAVIRGEAKSVDGQEDRRQAWRHLQYFTFHRNRFDFAAEIRTDIDLLFLYRLSGNRTCSYEQMQSILEKEGHVEMLDGWALGAGELTFRDAAYHKVDAEEDLKPFLLAMNPFVMNLLGENVQGAAEYHLSQQEVEALGETDAQMMLESVVLDDDEAQGIIGIPIVAVKRAAVVVFGTQRRDAVLRQDLGEIFGVVGKVRLRQGVSHEDVEAKLSSTAKDVLSHLLIRLPSLAASDDAVAYQRALTVLLDYAAAQLQLTFRTDRTVAMEVWDLLARQILNTPIFPGKSGLPISAMNLYRDFQRQAGAILARGEEEFHFQPRDLAEDAPPALKRWMDRHFRLEEILRPACQAYRGELPKSDDEKREQARCIEATLDHWINALRPDSDEHDYELRKRLHIHVQVQPDEEFFAGNLSDEFCQYVEARPGSNTGAVLRVNGDHWISRWLLAEGERSPRAIAWATLAGYAHINNVLERVTNDHELIFQQRVALALEEGRLEMVAG